MKNIVDSVKDLKKSAGGQLDEGHRGGLSILNSRCAWWSNELARMQDEIYGMGDKVKDMGEIVTAYGKAVRIR